MYNHVIVRLCVQRKREKSNFPKRINFQTRRTALLLDLLAYPTTCPNHHWRQSERFQRV